MVEEEVLLPTQPWKRRVAMVVAVRVATGVTVVTGVEAVPPALPPTPPSPWPSRHPRYRQRRSPTHRRLELKPAKGLGEALTLLLLPLLPPSCNIKGPPIPSPRRLLFLHRRQRGTEGMVLGEEGGTTTLPRRVV